MTGIWSHNAGTINCRTNPGGHRSPSWRRMPLSGGRRPRAARGCNDSLAGITDTEKIEEEQKIMPTSAYTWVLKGTMKKKMETTPIY